MQMQNAERKRFNVSTVKITRQVTPRAPPKSKAKTLNLSSEQKVQTSTY